MASKFLRVWTCACLLALLSSATLPVPATAQAPAYITQWGTFGSGPGQFANPYDVEVDASGNVFVADAENNRIQKFGNSGSFVTQWGGYWQPPNPGTGNGLFASPRGVAIDAAGNVYVSDSNNNRIQKFTNDGTYITQWGSPGGTTGSGNGQFNSPFGLAVDGSGNVYVADGFNNRIQKFTGDGVYLAQWGTLGSAVGVTVDAGYNVYVSGFDMRVQKFTSDGTYLTQWGSLGGGNGEFFYPWGMATDAVGHVYVADAENYRIQVFSGNGTYLTQWGTQGSGNSQFGFPTGVALDVSGNVFVADRENNRIQKFGHMPTPTKSTTWGRLKRMYR
jgi:sugar lactone lactonase YvrE